ncbi:unnamed protein product, partial [Didymodactylos carnosus]
MSTSNSETNTNNHPDAANSFNYSGKDVDLDGQTHVQQKHIEQEVVNFCYVCFVCKELMKKYKYIRKTRGDGNCFYRAFGFGYLEQNLKNELELDRFRKLVADLKDKLVQLGYQEFTVEDVRDVVLETIDKICQGGDIPNLMKIFCTQEYSDYFVAYLRLFTSAYLQMNAEFFQSFLDEPSKTIKEFCCT